MLTLNLMSMLLMTFRYGVSVFPLFLQGLKQPEIGTVDLRA